MRRRAPLGAASQRRRAAGGPRVQGRAAASVRAWAALTAAVWRRADGFCEVRLDGVRCRRRAMDPNHVRKCSAGGPDHPDNVIAVCRAHHDQTDVAYARGRLVVAPLGRGRFASRIVTKAHKWAPDPA